MSALPRALARGVDVAANARVVALRRGHAGWHLVVEGEGGARAEHGPFAAVLLALPPAQAAALLDASNVPGPVRDVAFAARDALQPCLCTMATFVRAPECAEGGMFVTDEALSWASHDGGKPQRSGAATYVLHGTAKWSSQNFERDPLETARELVAAFSRSLGAPLPDVVALDAHRWRYAIANEAFGNAPSVVDADARLGLAVDALAGGRVEGAWLSGRAAAERMLRALAN
jgi:predicted NAD/FAD-dependent oxidoreductase